MVIMGLVGMRRGLVKKAKSEEPDYSEQYQRLRFQIRKLELTRQSWYAKTLRRENLALLLQLEMEVNSLRQSWISRDPKPLKTEGLKCIRCTQPLQDRDNGRPQQYCRRCFMRHRAEYFHKRYVTKKAASVDFVIKTTISREERML